MANAYVQTPQGKLLEVPEENLPAFQADVPGTRVLTPEQVNEALRVQQVRTEESGAIGAAKQFAQSFVRGAVPGELPVIESLVRGYEKAFGTPESEQAAVERMRIRQEQQQGADVAGTVSGFLASTLATGGESAALRVGLGSGARATTFAGEKAAEIASKVAARTNSQIAQRAVQSSIGQAVARGVGEATAGAVGGVARDAVLGRDLSAELVAHQMVEAGVLGGATSGLFGALGAAARKGAEQLTTGGAGALAGVVVGGAIGGLPGAAIGGVAGSAFGRRAARNAELLAEHESTRAAERAARETIETKVAKPGSPLTPDELDNVFTAAEPGAMQAEQGAAAAGMRTEEDLAAMSERAAKHAEETQTLAGEYDAQIRRFSEALKDDGPLGMETRKVLAETDDTISKAERAFPKDMDEVLDALNVSRNFTTSDARRKQFVELAKHENADPRSAWEAMIPELEATVEDLRRAARTPGATTAVAPIEKLANEAEITLKKIRRMGEERIEREALMGGPEIRPRQMAPEDVGRMAGMVNDLKNDMQRVASKGFGLSSNSIDIGIRNRLRQELQERLRLTLEKRSIVGEQIAGTQRLGNKSWTDLLTNMDDFTRSFTRRGERSEFDPFEKIALGDSAKLSGFVQSLGTAANADKLALMQTQLPKIAEHLRTQLRLYPHGAYAARVEAGIKAAERMMAQLDDKVPGSALAAYYTREGAKALQSGMESKLFAKAAGAVPVIGEAVTLLADMQKRVMVQQALDSTVAQYDRRVSESVRKFMAGAERPGRIVAEVARRGAPEARETMGREVPPSPVPAPKAPVKATALGEERASTRDVLRQMATVTAATQGPRLNVLVTNAVMPITSPRDPGLGIAVANGMARAAAFLASKVPPGALGGDPSSAQPQFAQTPLTDSQIAQWRTYVQTVRDPLTVLDDLAKGTVSREQAEALRVVYPAVYTAIQARIMGELRDFRRPISYGQRVLLFQLFGAAIDPTLQPASIRGLQASFAPVQPPAPMGASGTPGRVRGSFAAGMRTSSESLAANKALP